jgi:hypothetical protein
MAIVVEDGTGKTDAVAYVSAAGADAYFLARANTAWVGSATAKEAAIVRATFALDGLYGNRWPGYKSSSGQALDWPRDEAYDIDGYELSGLPTAIVNAACEAALIELVSANSINSSVTNGVKVETVGPITTEYFSSSGSKTVYKTISAPLARIVMGGGTIKLSRG